MERIGANWIEGGNMKAEESLREEEVGEGCVRCAERGDDLAAAARVKGWGVKPHREGE